MNYIKIKNIRINLDNITHFEPTEVRRGKINSCIIDYGIYFSANNYFVIYFEENKTERDLIISQLDRMIYVQSLPSTTQPVNKLWPEDTKLHDCTFDADGGPCTICGKTVMESLEKNQTRDFALQLSPEDTKSHICDFETNGGPCVICGKTVADWVIKNSIPAD